MKTPREVLLNRHRDKLPKLDAVRERVVAIEVRRTDGAGHVNVSLAVRIALALWRELILPAQRIWAGLAAVWLLIAAINTAGSGSVPVAKAHAPMLPREMAAAIQEQHRVIAELTGVTESKAADRPLPAVPRPRSACRTKHQYV